MRRTKIKVAVVYNEPEPEMYLKPPEKTENSSTDFVPYFEVDKTTPMEEYEYVVQRLKNVGLDAFTLNIKDNLQLLLSTLQDKKPDVIFNFVELFKDNSRLEMNIVGMYELLGIPYTGAPALSLANCQNKILAKRLLSTSGIRIPKFFIVTEKSTRYTHRLKYPFFNQP